MVRGDLPSTLPFAFHLLCLEPKVGKGLKQKPKLGAYSLFFLYSTVDIIPVSFPSTLPLDSVPEDRGVSGSLEGLSEPWLAMGVSEGCPASSLENTCLEGSSAWLQGGVWSSRENWVPRGKSNSEDEVASKGRTGSGGRFDLGASVSNTSLSCFTSGLEGSRGEKSSEIVANHSANRKRYRSFRIHALVGEGSGREKSR